MEKKHGAVVASGLAAVIAITGFASLDGSSDTVDLQGNAFTKEAPVQIAAGQSTTDSVSWDVVAAKVNKSVVSVATSSTYRSGIGSGVIISDDGYIVTNNHVVANEKSTPGMIDVVLHDSTIYSAKVIKADADSDLAVLKMDNPPSGLRPIVFGDSSAITIGAPVMAFGSPLGLSGTVTNGIISAKNRPVASTRNDVPTMISALQTNAAINPGNSGGPLVDRSGNLVGINTSIATSGGSTGNIGIGFAVPSNTVKKVTDYLKRGEAFPYGRLGVSVGAASERADGTDILGAVVRDIMGGSAAARAGLKVGDLIVSVDGVRVADQSSLVGAIKAYAVGDTVELGIVSNGSTRSASVTLGS